MSLLAASIVKHILNGIYLIFLKALCRLNVRGFEYQILISVERSEKYLSRTTNLGLFFKKLP